MARRSKDEIISYVFEIDSIAPDYNFASRSSRFEPGPFNERLTFRFKAVCLLPENLKGREIDGWVLGQPSSTFFGTHIDESRVHFVATLEMGKRRSAMTAFIPNESIWALLAAAHTGIMRYMILRGPPLFRSKSLISDFYFYKEIDLEEW